MDTFLVRVAARRALTEDIAEFTLAPVGDDPLPPAEPGAHITVKTPAGPSRRYSLVRPGASPETYVIAVKREAESRGGSASMHDDAVEGTELEIEPPENDFPLGEALDYLLIAGGIGVTPIYAMAQHLWVEGRDVRVIYCTRSEAATAYLDELRELLGDRLVVHHDAGDPEAAYDFWDDFEEPGKGHVYCCGPKVLMEEIEAVSGHWPETAIRFEDFKPVDVVRADDAPFEVELQRSGQTVEVPADRSILEAVRDAGVPTVSSCESGTCGTCRTRLIAGEVDHRDMVLTPEEREVHVMICISRAKAGRLVLDL